MRNTSRSQMETKRRHRVAVAALLFAVVGLGTALSGCGPTIEQPVKGFTNPFADTSVDTKIDPTDTLVSTDAGDAVNKPCSVDADCGAGQQCHPTLLWCLTLPCVANDAFCLGPYAVNCNDNGDGLSGAPKLCPSGTACKNGA